MVLRGSRGQEVFPAILHHQTGGLVLGPTDAVPLVSCGIGRPHGTRDLIYACKACARVSVPCPSPEFIGLIPTIYLEFWRATHRGAQGFLLALCAQRSLLRGSGYYMGAKDQTQIGHVQPYQLNYLWLPTESEDRQRE